MRPRQCGTFTDPADMHPGDRDALEEYRAFLTDLGVARKAGKKALREMLTGDKWGAYVRGDAPLEMPADG